jgi:sulfopyruvate decarboxylase TPP-binding subunit
MLDGPTIVRVLKACGVTHVVWLPDSELGRWDAALQAEPDLHLIRVCREGEAVAIAAGLYLGGKQPIIAIQCTGLFEAGDSLRNIVHDLKLPLFFLVGVRSYRALQKGATADTCPVFTVPILDAWRLEHTFLDPDQNGADLATFYRESRSAGRAAVALLPE